MRIGAMSAYGMQPYVYNANTLSGASMNRVSGIADDVLDKKIDYSELTESENVNPLKRGQTLDFASMLAMQLQKGQNSAARVMRPAAGPRTEEEDETRPAKTEAAQPAQTSEPAEETAALGNAADDGAAAGGNISYRMQQALNAYEMFMTA